jgi:hypothetical protein
MTKKLKDLILPLICALFFLAGCYEKLDWEFPHFESKPVMNSILVSGKPLKVHVSLTVPYGPKESIVVKDAEVNLFVDGEFAETLIYQEKGYYLSELIAEVDKEYTCEVHVGNYPVMRGSTIIPKPTRLLGIEHINIAGIDEEGHTYPAVKITFENRPGTFACNQIVINYLAGLYDEKWYRPAILNYIDPVLLNEGLPMTVFSNEYIEGDKYTMTINYTTGATESSGEGTTTVLYPLKVEFRTLSHCYYKFAKQLYLYEYNNEEPFFSGVAQIPVTLYSNIENGYGIFAGYSYVTSKVIDPNQ